VNVTTPTPTAEPKQTPPQWRPVSVWMRRMLLSLASLATFAGLQLFVGSEHTDRYFAWTIAVPLTAAFLGGMYWAAAVLLAASARSRTWAEARTGAVSALVLITLVLIAMLVHIDLFHTGSDEAITLVGTWIFIVTYVWVPPATLAAVVHQLRQPGRDLAPEPTFPGWFRGVVAVQAAVMVAVGGALVLVPGTADALWSWPLTALTGRAVGAFVLATGVAIGMAAWAADPRHARPAFASGVVLAVLELIALARFPDDVDWDGAAAWVYLAFVLAALGTSAVGLARGGRAGERRRRVGRRPEDVAVIERMERLADGVDRISWDFHRGSSTCT
jgi:hypothetical protein